MQPTKPYEYMMLPDTEPGRAAESNLEAEKENGKLSLPWAFASPAIIS